MSRFALDPSVAFVAYGLAPSHEQRRQLRSMLDSDRDMSEQEKDAAAASRWRIVNLTAHDIVLRSPAGDVVVPPSGYVARVEIEREEVEHHDGLPVPYVGHGIAGTIVGMPPSAPTWRVSYLVSGLVASVPDAALWPMYSPGTGPGDEPIRDATGQIVAVTRLVRARC